ncbi:MAG: DNA polymerase III subunit gamma/tau [Thermomicrobiales bacterium]
MTMPSLFGDAEPVAAPPVPPQVAAPAGRGQTQSLYRKYRPQTFDEDELVGQEHIVRTLRNAILLDRVAHAYLFCGPRGTGKTTTARLLAKAVNCLDPDVMRRPCNRCAACLAIATGATADVIEIDAASNRGIDDIRDLRERVKYAPSQLRTKFYIIDEAHQITGAAANAFLKTLEEPPPHTKFVLATTDPEELLPTIVSRCQRFDFRRVGAEATVARLRSVAGAEGLRIDDDALRTIARHSTGSMRDALSLLDQLSVYVERNAENTESAEITMATVLALLGVSRNERVELLVEAMAKRDPAQALCVVNAAIDAGEDPRQLNRQLVTYLRILLHERAGGSPDADARAKTLALGFELAQISRLARNFSETDHKIRHSSYPQLPLEIALVDAIVGSPPHRQDEVAAAHASAPRTAAQPAATPPAQSAAPEPATTTWRDKVRGVTGAPAAQPVPPAPQDAAPDNVSHMPSAQAAGARPAAPALDGPLSVDQLADLWPRIRGDVKAVNRRVEALLASIDPVAVDGFTVTLASAYDFHRKRMNDGEVRRVVEDAISRIVGSQVTITCVLRSELGELGLGGAEPGKPPQPAGAPAAPSPQSAAQNADEQRIQAAKNIFDGEEMPT